MDKNNTVHIDHNIIDFIHKNPESRLDKTLKEKYQVIFTDENLSEIERCGNQSDDYAEILSRLCPLYLEICFNDDNIPNDEAMLREYPVAGSLKIRRERVPSIDEIKTKIMQPLLKILGGRPGEGAEKIFEEQRVAMHQIAHYVGNDISEKEIKSSDVAELARLEVEKLKEKYDEDINTRMDEAKKLIGADHTYDGLKSLRAEIKVEPKILNNIKGGKVIQKIWEKAKDSDYVTKNGMTLERLFGIEKGFHNFDQELPIYYKAYVMYLMLNVIGFHQDEGILKTNRFISASSDSYHVANAIFADQLLSMDKKLCAKARAVYEYLGIGTQVIHLIK